MLLSKSFITPSKIRFKHTTAALEKIRERLENGPSFQDFVQSPSTSKEELAKEFEGKLRKEKGDKERLRLPPWLKTQIPIGESKQIILILLIKVFTQAKIMIE